MITITIPKKITKGKELVIVPREDWEKLWKIAQKKVNQIELEKGLKEALEDIKKGRVIGPFSTSKEAIAALKCYR